MAELGIAVPVIMVLLFVDIPWLATVFTPSIPVYAIRQCRKPRLFFR